MRIHLDPTPEAGGGAPSAPAAPVTPAPVQPQNPPAVTVTADDYRAFLKTQQELIDLRASQQAAIDAANAKANEAKIKAGQIEEGLKAEQSRYEAKLAEKDAQLAASEGERLNDRFEAVVSQSLSTATYADEFAAEQVRAIIGPRFEAVRDPSTRKIVVQEKGTFRPAADVIKEWLASPQAHRFLRATNTGGVAVGGNNPSPTGAQGAQPRNLGEAAIFDYQSHRNAAADQNVNFGLAGAIGRN